NHKLLVEYRQLDGNARQLTKPPWRLVDLVPAIFIIKVNQHISVHAVAGQQDENDKIRDQQRQVEAIYLVEALECLVHEMGAEIMAKAALIEHGRRKQHGRTEVQANLLGELRIQSGHYKPTIVPELRCARASQRSSRRSI